jgi:hypothetical protein
MGSDAKTMIGAGDHGCERVARSVERAGIERLAGPQSQRKRKPEKINGGGFGIRKGEVSAAIDEIDQRKGNGHHPAGHEQRSGGDAIDRSIHGGGELVELFLSKQARVKRKRRLAGGLSEDGDGNGEQTLGVVEARDVADSAGGEVAEDPVVGGDQETPSISGMERRTHSRKAGFFRSNEGRYPVPILAAPMALMRKGPAMLPISAPKASDAMPIWRPPITPPAMMKTL